MRGRVFISAVMVAAGGAAATESSFEGLSAKASLSADASGKLLGERFTIPATTARKASKELEHQPIADAIIFQPDLGFVEGTAGASYTATVTGNLITGSSKSAVSVEADDTETLDANLMLTTSASVVFDFTLPHTVAADLSVAMSHDEGFGKVRTTLTGPAMQPMLDLERSGDLGRSLILPPGSYRLTFTHLAAAKVETNTPEPEADAKSGARFSLAVDPCGADCNGDNTLDILDYICFQQRMEDRHKKSDLNNDGKFDILDMVVFQELFVSGCDK